MGWHNNFPDRLLLINENKTGYTYIYVILSSFFPSFEFKIHFVMFTVSKYFHHITLSSV